VESTRTILDYLLIKSRLRKMTAIEAQTKKILKELKSWCKKNRGGPGQVARELEVERQTVANWISGHRTPQLAHLSQLERFLEKKARGE
jgi:hypothetical protein